eukprot:12693705-Heterocapsa_arctica.AAC.1
MGVGSAIAAVIRSTKASAKTRLHSSSGTGLPNPSCTPSHGSPAVPAVPGPWLPRPHGSPLSRPPS